MIKISIPKSVKIHPKEISKTHIPIGYAKYQYSAHRAIKVRIPNSRFASSEEISFVSSAEISILFSVVKEIHDFSSLISSEVLATGSSSVVGFPLESNFLHLKSHSASTVAARRESISNLGEVLTRKEHDVQEC